MDIGSKLKEKRQDMGLSLEDVSSKTLISIKYLDAIENSRFSEIPAEVMLTGFLQNYSNLLGINPEEIIAEYKKTHRPGTLPPIIKLRLKDMPHKKIFKIKIWQILLFLFIVFSLIGIFKISSLLLKSKTEKIKTGQEVKKNLLELRTTENVWIRIKTGGTPIFEGILPPNTTKTFESTEEFRLRIGNRAGITVFLNGKPVKLSKDKLAGEIKLP